MCGSHRPRRKRQLSEHDPNLLDDGVKPKRMRKFSGISSIDFRSAKVPALMRLASSGCRLRTEPTDAVECANPVDYLRASCEERRTITRR